MRAITPLTMQFFLLNYGGGSFSEGFTDPDAAEAVAKAAKQG